VFTAEQVIARVEERAAAPLELRELLGWEVAFEDGSLARPRVRVSRRQHSGPRGEARSWHCTRAALGLAVLGQSTGDSSRPGGRRVDD
jgi:hypothetical protein